MLVGATEYHPTENRRAWFSNYGPRIVISLQRTRRMMSHVMFPLIVNTLIFLVVFQVQHQKLPGPVAMMLSINPNLTQQEIVTILNSTGTPVVTDTSKPVGNFLNCDAAVRAVRLKIYQFLHIAANGDDGNVPANTIDNNLNTRWSNFGIGSWIRADLGSQKTDLQCGYCLV